MEGVWMQITLNLATEDYRRLREKAEEAGLGVPDLAVNIVRRYLEQEKFSGGQQ